jgi:2-keto-4-pentenoate hydratase/2-oxohepta-3-ene-1,7-dioic acid hydratase in catechol pathway
MASERRFARTVDGRSWVGDESGFVPLESALPGVDDVTDALSARGDSLADVDVDDAPARRVPASSLAFRTPFDPGKLWGIGLNYADHAADLSEVRPDAPASFMKPATALTGPGGPIRLPAWSDRVTAEAELGVVIGRTCSDVARAAFGEVVAGFVPVIDVTCEDVLARNPRFLTRAKSFDTAIVVGPWLSAPATLDRLADVTVRTVVNGETVAENDVDGMLFPPDELVSFHSRVMTLEPGDLLSTGTPGAGVIEPGDRVRAEIDGLAEDTSAARRTRSGGACVLEADVVGPSEG